MYNISHTIGSIEEKLEQALDIYTSIHGPNHKTTIACKVNYEILTMHIRVLPIYHHCFYRTNSVSCCL